MPPAKRNAKNPSISADQKDNSNEDDGEGGHEDDVEIPEDPAHIGVAGEEAAGDKGIEKDKKVHEKWQEKEHPYLAQLVLARGVGEKEGDLGGQGLVPEEKHQPHKGVASEKSICHSHNYTALEAVFRLQIGNRYSMIGTEMT